MIRKFLICGKQPFLASRQIEAATGPVVEIFVPVQIFWQIQELIKKIEYMISASEDPVVINELQTRVYAKLARYAVHEKDRIMLIARGGGSPLQSDG